MREHFDLDPALVYLNSGTHSICPRVVTEAITRHQREYERNPTAALIAAWPRVWVSQQRLARFLNADPRDLALRTNVTHAMNDVILGLPLKAGSEILVTDLEYGAVVNACRFRAERDGLVVRDMHLPLNAEDDAIVAKFEKALTPKTALAVVSHVTTGTGLVLPLARLARVCRARGIVLAVDGAHAPGALPVDLSKLHDVDFYGGNLHKWVMGPKGTGFAWTNPKSPIHQTLQPLMAGWPTFEKPEMFGEFGGGSRFAERHAPLGCYDFAPLFAITEIFDFWHRLGAETIRQRLLQLQLATEEAMKAHGWALLSPPAGPQRGPLLTFELPAKLATAGGHPLMAEILAKTGVQVSVPKVQGRWTLRLAPHIYNAEDEIVGAVKRLAAFAAT